MKEQPSWPSFEPLLPTSDLELTEIVPGQIVTIPSLWTPSLCKKYVKFLEKLPLTTTSAVPKKGDAVRVNDRFQIDDPAFAERLWSATGLEELVLGHLQKGPHGDIWGGRVLGLNPNIRVYRYRPGHYFDQHYDESNNVTLSSTPGIPSTPARTTWTLLLYLTSSTTGCEGGQTVFYPESPSTKKVAKNQQPPDPISVELETGMALLHKHGKDCMLHEGREVTAGEKWVIRSDLCVAR